MKTLLTNPHENLKSLEKLSTALSSFYEETVDYSAYQEVVHHEELFALLLPFIQTAVENLGRVKILEIGAGKTSLPTFLRKHNISSFDYTAQDIVEKNLDYLNSVSDEVFIGKIVDMEGKFDFIIHTYVLEHIANPLEFLSNVHRLLNNGGWHIIFCPKYDIPGYIPPSIRYGSIFKQVSKHLGILFQIYYGRLTGIERFIVNKEPAIFHKQWFRDADAVHFVSKSNIVEWHRKKGYLLKTFQKNSQGVKSFLVNNFLTLNIGFQKRTEY